MRKATKAASDVLGNRDVKAIALQLQRMGRGKDTILAHITPEEAAKLKAEGGAGTRNPETGLLEFQDIADIPFYDYGGYEGVQSYGGGISDVPYYDYGGYEPSMSADFGGYGTGDIPVYDYGGYGGFDYLADLPSAGAQEVFFTPSATPTNIPMPLSRADVFAGRAEAPLSEAAREERLMTPEEIAAEEEKSTAPPGKSALSGLLDKLTPGTLARLGLGLGGALMGQQQAAAARRQGAAAAEALRAAYEKSAADVRALAQPLTTAGTAALGQAQQGVLDPARLQQLEAARAQLAQQAAKTGGVGAIQSAEALNRARLAALQAQQTAALQLLGPGNQLMAQAISRQLQGTTTAIGTRLQLEQQANQAMANLYAQLGRFIGG